ncbi:uncharacterized protein YbjT (DUF2867 family) [Antricoccus suffuscus]|uniref:Uncharacterized protein YbjT (DUF2867 family) n=1 Tax=Antricoccus suffuscus TaxID=1629062 RepID=A0A2T1A157_9ACTN|nr:NAD(P)H-binding protein [Antricoccus suffuscus]PRZ42336.1 uncharacterized protein YbjT (DUF2867 family) [Antricoccus suffuscus]
MKFAIAGGTGAVGRHVAAAAQRAGHTPLVLSRGSGFDLMNVDGLADHLTGVDAVIDVSSPSTLSTKKILAFFGTVTGNLLTAERDAGVPHHVALSIIGAAAHRSGYYAGKALQEDLVTASGSTWSMLRTTQFHEFSQQTVNRGTLAGLLISPKMRTQPIAAADVAAELVRIAEGLPRDLEPDLAGPREEYIPDMVRKYARAVGKNNPLLAVPMPGAAGKAMRNGGLLPDPGSRTSSQTFDEWLTTTTEGIKS